MREDFDVVIIGAGPAGSAMAGYLAMAGIPAMILERETFPREHVGESLVPSSTRVFQDLGFLRKMEEAKFPHKYGAAWTSAVSSRTFNDRVSYKSDFDVDWTSLWPKEDGSEDLGVDVQFDERAQSGVNQPYTYHVDRGRMDHLLLDHVCELGASAMQGAKVTDVTFLPDAAGAIVTARQGEEDHVFKCKLVVDASGRHTVVGRKKGLMVKDPVFDQYAVHTWFKNLDRGSAAKGDFIYVHFLPTKDSWVWQIPITDEITSIGVVSQKRYVMERRVGHDEFFWSFVNERPDLSRRLKAAEQIRPFKVESDYSYAMRELCGDNFVLVGDAARFVDPIFSTGVSIALNSARFASRDAIAALKSNTPLTKQAFATFDKTIRIGTQNWYRFISLYYRLNVLFTAFISDPRYRLDVLKLLQGDVYDEVNPPVMARMQAMVEAVEADDTHMLHSYLGSLRADVQNTQMAVVSA